MFRCKSSPCISSVIELQIAEIGKKALDREDNLIGVVISKLESHRGGLLRGYIAMLAVKQEYRGRGIATNLVRMALDIMIEREAEEVSLLIILCIKCQRQVLLTISDCP